MTKEINLTVLWKILKSAWWKILIIALAAAIVVGVAVEFLVDKKYSSSVEFYIINTSTTSEYTTTSLLASAEYLASDYINIINSDRMVDDHIIPELEEAGLGEYSPRQIRAMLSSATATTSSTFTITVTDTDPKVCNKIAKIIEEHAPTVIREITRPSYISNYYRRVVENGEEKYVPITESDLECVRSVRSPNTVSVASPGVVTIALIAAVAAAVIAVIIMLIRKLSDTTIRSEAAVQELLDPSITVIGSIPHWNTRTGERKL